MSSPYEYRFYSFTNFYLSSIQKGIQTAHAISEMSVTDYGCKEDRPKIAYAKWATFDKTVIVLNGGNQSMLEVIFSIATEFANRHHLPVVKFHEDEQSLNGALTAVGIILPKDVYETASDIRAGKDFFNNFIIPDEDMNFYKTLNSCGLAN